MWVMTRLASLPQVLCRHPLRGLKAPTRPLNAAVRVRELKTQARFRGKVLGMTSAGNAKLNADRRDTAAHLPPTFLFPRTYALI